MSYHCQDKNSCLYCSELFSPIAKFFINFLHSVWYFFSTETKRHPSIIEFSLWLREYFARGIDEAIPTELQATMTLSIILSVIYGYIDNSNESSEGTGFKMKVGVNEV